MRRIESLVKICIILLVIVILLQLFGCKDGKVNVVHSGSIPDTTLVSKDSCYAQIWHAQRETATYRDSVDILKDSIVALDDRLRLLRASNSELNENLGIAQFKLLRIREYNRIAGQRNNIKYLRGWINRVLEH